MLNAVWKLLAIFDWDTVPSPFTVSTGEEAERSRTGILLPRAVRTTVTCEETIRLQAEFTRKRA